MPNDNNRYGHNDYADMHLIYGETRHVSTRGNVTYNARLAARLYAERYPNRTPPTYEVILRVANAYREGRVPGIGARAGRPRTTDPQNPQPGPSSSRTEPKPPETEKKDGS